MDLTKVHIEDKSIDISQKGVTGEGCLDELHHSSLYLEPVHVTGNPQVGSIANRCPPCVESKTYLQVILLRFLTILFNYFVNVFLACNIYKKALKISFIQNIYC